VATLTELAQLLRADESVVTPHVVDSADPAAPLGVLAGAGPRTAARRDEYALVVEAVREGYLLHYAADGRVVRGADRDLRLLAGDYLYALGLERLAALGDLEAVRELSDLISLAAQVHDGSHEPGREARESAAVWLAGAVAIAAGADPAHEQAKRTLRAGEAGAAEALWRAAATAAAAAGFSQALGEGAAGLDFRFDQLSSLG